MRSIASVVFALWAGSGILSGQAAHVGAVDQTFRVFLKDGQVLPSYGESVVVDDRVVFTLPLGAPGTHSALQLMSVPSAAVDLERTADYAYAMRAKRYAAMRGEADYLAMTDEVSRALDQLRGIEDAGRRLALADEARRRLLAWSRENYFYRSADIRELAGLFDAVIAELRAAAGEASFSMDLAMGPAQPALEPLLEVPTFRDSIELALGAARATDIAEERLAILRAASDVLATTGGLDDLEATVDRELGAEEAADAAYAAMEAQLGAAAAAARDRGDMAAVERLRSELAVRDRTLGYRRPARVRALRARLEALADEALGRRLEMDRFLAGRAGRLAYQRSLRPVTRGFDSLKPVLLAIRDLRSTAVATLDGAMGRMDDLTASLARLDAPDDLADVHATLSSALLMAAQALARWRLAVITANTARAREASTAASGAMLLAEQARSVLADRLRPPTVR
jgi:hypothetical protein